MNADAHVAGPVAARLMRWPARRTLLRSVAAVCGVFLLVWCGWVYSRIEQYATTDQARPADAIAVFGAAEYDGARPRSCAHGWSRHCCCTVAAWRR